MSKPANPRQLSVLSKIVAGDGYQVCVADEAAAEECIADEWLYHDGPLGYGMTLDGWIMMRVRGCEFPPAVE